ncbi:MAG TPA: efflux RND transporter periplasmic adaptor subunit, partial [Comamonas sp.]
LLVPNAALRFTPVGMSAPAASDTKSGQGGSAPAPEGEREPRPQGQGASRGGNSGIMGQLMPQRPRMSRGAGGSQALGAGQTRYVWVLEGGTPVAVQVKTGLSDGRMTEVESEALKEGAQVITDQRSGAGQ